MTTDAMTDQSVIEAGVAEFEQKQRAINVAYGLLWHMRTDTRDPNLCLARAARTALLLEMTKEEQAAGIAAAREQFQ